MSQAPPAPVGTSGVHRLVINNQIAALKVFQTAVKYRCPTPLPPHWLPHMKPPPLGDVEAARRLQPLKDEGQKLRLEIARKVRAAIAAQQQQQNGGQQPAQQQQQNGGQQPAQQQQQNGGQQPAQRQAAGTQLPPRPPPAAAPVAAPLETATLAIRPGPLYTSAVNTAGGRGQAAAGAPLLQPQTITADVPGLMQAEYQRMIQRRYRERVAELEAIVADPAADPGMKQRQQRLPAGTAQLQLRMLRAVQVQSQLRAAIDNEAREIAALSERQYRMLFRTHRASRIETARRELAHRAEVAAGRVRDSKTYRSETMSEHASASRDLRVARNRLVTRAHERLAREHNRLKDDDRALRMEALKAHDFEAYQEMLRRQTGTTPAAGERYEAISKFLADTEAYLNRLAGKIAAVKMSAEASSAAARAIADARARGLSEEEVQAAARAAAAEAATGSEALRAVAEGAGDAQARYYQLAHSNQEEVPEQPRLLHPPNGATLRQYQLVGLQWMVSLYNNHLNGILADEMGLGKTVQVMALIAYLMDKKANYGPHLIIVPNAVMVNWKSELTQWLPTARCVYYVGKKEERAHKYTAEVQPLQFNVLVTTYEFIMRDRAKLSKIDWQYIVIDEAQRMRDRQSKLAKDLDRFTAARRLLLSGTPLQNDLLELWSLLNLLLPDVFDDKNVFAEWFGDSVGGSGAGGGSDDWLAKEKRVVVIHRLHQILEPFMLRRQVEDVESKLPAKVAFTVRAPMSAHQSATYSWVKITGTLRLDPSAPQQGRVHREYASLQNKCMELRKVCNHPLLSNLPQHWNLGEAVVRQCGKLVVLDRMLVKLKAAGHRVLLFSTMTKLLDLLETYLQWRELPPAAGGGRMVYLRLDGSTSLDDRERAIQRFNSPDSDAFIFLLSIRAAGRGLNLQSSDTVVIYDPDPNPKNEEQAIARSHRIGQTKEVRVFHLEAVTDASAAAQDAARVQQAEDAVKAAAAVEVRAQAAAEAAADAAGPPAEGDVSGSKAPPPVAKPAELPAKEPAAPPPAPTTADGGAADAPGAPLQRLYGDSIESVVRGRIQKLKIEMANEVIDAGRFDQQTSMEERRHTLEALLQDQDNNRAAAHTVPTLTELNRMLARGPEELALFEKMDVECEWYEATRPEELPRWMRYSEADLRSALELSAKHKMDVEGEIAALTGTVLHHHAAVAEGEAAARKERKATAAAGAAAADAPAGARPGGAAPQSQPRPQPAAAAPAGPPAAPAATTTTRSSLGGEGEGEEEEVGMEDNDEEEEVLEQNLVADDSTDATGLSGGAVAGGMKRVASTAAAPMAVERVGAAAEDAAPTGGDVAKRRRTLSVHFEDQLMDEDPPPPPPAQ